MITVQPTPFYSVWKYRPLVERLTLTVEFPQFICEATAMELVNKSPKKYYIDAYNLLNGSKGKKYARLGNTDLENTDPNAMARNFAFDNLDSKDINFKISLTVPKGEDTVLLDSETGLVEDSLEEETFIVRIRIINGWEKVWNAFVFYYLNNIPLQILEKLKGGKVRLRTILPDDRSIKDNVPLSAEEVVTWLLAPSNQPEEWLSLAWSILEYIRPQDATGNSGIGQEIFGAGFAEAFNKCQIKAACQCSWFNAIQREGSSKEWVMKTEDDPKFYETNVYKWLTKAELELLDNPKIKKAVEEGKPLYSTQPDRLAVPNASDDDSLEVDTKAPFVRTRTKGTGKEVSVFNAGEIYTKEEVDEIKDIVKKLPDNELEVVPQEELQKIMRYPCLHILRVLMGGEPVLSPDGKYDLSKMLGQSVASAVWVNENKGLGGALYRNYENYVEGRLTDLEGKASATLNKLVKSNFELPRNEKGAVKYPRQRRTGVLQATAQIRKDLGMEVKSPGVKKGDKRGKYKERQPKNTNNQ